ncbi:PQ-loop-domain-containing protein [Wolfiporia cocos MD-104 SS10]|uniref:PQ-loop-domain-containing protein n=1 Tax=Wolfiporia cocos (strain MD-104) TaxID=742152 RepID=A0A2H3JU37_WOLCO|nr:PQ-loop-domain-containing protein [Wolfiporia cocos MD-104 SS10]
MHVVEYENLSNVLGWVSIACWLIVYTPQIIENYQRKSGEGLSVLFVIIWLAGDLCNLVGALMAHLIPTVIILALYYSACDIILLFQIYYYRYLKSASAPAPLLVPDDSLPSDLLEETPLLARDNDTEGGKTKTPVLRELARFAGALCFVFVVGVAAWAVDDLIRKGQARSKPEEIVEWRSQVLGWLSAVMYLGARIPQIAKNFETRCEGLSPFLFVYSITGNSTYVLSILTASTEKNHIVANAAWIAGSALTVFLDAFVICQFFYYRAADQRLSKRGGM